MPTVAARMTWSTMRVARWHPPLSLPPDGDSELLTATANRPCLFTTSTAGSRCQSTGNRWRLLAQAQRDGGTATMVACKPNRTRARATTSTRSIEA
ncbi:hypothetical protein E2562_002128 [Oryza meyeriana var. granulata]|uniref:Uncharacterized protein n=1 Tax=Oryza meyeriana var. granulata TaxID=110450 RepID=A0A6G1EDQ8_9ORYZ|nr:hypothetical protein E2562_002128 [Oryza meyeriana var. granulata]